VLPLGPPPIENEIGQRHEPTRPTSAAAITIDGKGTSSKKIDAKAAKAMATIQPNFSAREPMGCAACSTSTFTAGSMA